MILVSPRVSMPTPLTCEPIDIRDESQFDALNIDIDLLSPMPAVAESSEPSKFNLGIQAKPTTGTKRKRVALGETSHDTPLA